MQDDDAPDIGQSDARQDRIDVEDLLVAPDDTIAQAIECLERNGGEIALVTDGTRRLLGTVTDGDVRRGLLRGVTLQDRVAAIMNRKPRFGQIGQTRDKLRALLVEADIEQLPLLDEAGRLHQLLLRRPVALQRRQPNRVVLMAGGVGERLRPLTDTTPKPMIEVGGKPLLETILNSFVAAGFYRIAISVNYLGQQIIDHFGDGGGFGAEITYLREARRLGTAGALSLLSPKPSEPLIVMNCDILTNVNFAALLRFHEAEGCAATMGVNHFHYTVPYGVVDVGAERITGLREKPEYEFFVNAGIYVLSPDVLELIPMDQHFDMTQLFQKLLGLRYITAAFPLHEAWLDIGRPHDLKRAQEQYRLTYGMPSDQTEPSLS